MDDQYLALNYNNAVFDESGKKVIFHKPTGKEIQASPDAVAWASRFYFQSDSELIQKLEKD